MRRDHASHHIALRQRICSLVAQCELIKLWTSSRRLSTDLVKNLETENVYRPNLSYRVELYWQGERRRRVP